MRDGSFRDVAADAGLPAAAALHGASPAATSTRTAITDFFFGAIRCGRRARDERRARPLHDRAVPRSRPPARRRAVRRLRQRRSARSLYGDRPRGRACSGMPASGGPMSRRRQSWAPKPRACPPMCNRSRFGDLDRDGDLDAVLLLANGRAAHVAQRRRQRKAVARGAPARARVSNRGGDRVEGGHARGQPASAHRDLGRNARAWPGRHPLRARPPASRRRRPRHLAVRHASGRNSVSDVRATLTSITELDRKPSSCPYLYIWNGSRFEFVTDFMGGGEMGYWHAPGALEHAGSRRVRPDSATAQLQAARRPLRAARDERARGSTVRRSTAARGCRSRPRTSRSSRTKGLRAPSRVRRFDRSSRRRTPRTGCRAWTSTVTTCFRVSRRSTAATRTTSTLIDIRGYAEPHELTLDLGAHGATARVLLAHRLDRLRLFERQRRGAPARPAAAPAVARGRRRVGRMASSRSPNIGIPVGRPQTVVVDLRAARAPASARSGSSPTCGSTGTRSWSTFRRSSAAPARHACRSRRRRPAVARLLGRVTPDGREPFGYDYERVSSGLDLEDDGRAVHARRGRARAATRGRRHVRRSPGRATRSRCRSSAASCRRLPPAGRRTFLLFADGFSKEMDISVRQPARGRAAAVPRDAVAIRTVPRTVSVHGRPS